MKRNWAQMRRVVRRGTGVGLALAVAFLATPAFADHDGTLDPHTPPAMTLTDVGFTADSMLTPVTASVGPLLGAVLLAALSLAIIAFGGRRIMRYVTGRA